MKLSSAIIFLPLILFASCEKEEAPENKKAKWIENAFGTLNSNAFSNVKAISWWHENFDASKLRIDSSPESLEAYKNAVTSSNYITDPDFVDGKLVEPKSGIYHSAFPDFGGTEDIVTEKRINDFEALVGNEILWAYFSNNWIDAIEFPLTDVETIINAGRIPFVRIMPRSNFEEGGPDTIYTLQRIIDGDFDAELVQWALDAANSGIPLLAEFGTEVNGNWFPWNGQYNGGGDTNGYGDPEVADGPERFRDAYRHIIELCNENGANNITWFFHVDAYCEPDTDWNQIKNYYPGDGYIDWLGVSIYGPQESSEDYQEFSEIMNDIYPSLISLSDKPIAILEFAITEIE